MTKTIFITGASTGIGKATAQYFATKGWNVIATMRNPQAAADLAENERISILPLDVTKPEQITKIVEQVTSNHNIDVVLNNAGYGTVGPLEGTSDAEINQIIHTNLLGVIQLTKAFIPHFREKKSGVFITTSSAGGLVAYPYFSLYHATKWAVEGWTESMAFELSAFGIQIKTVQPGPTATDFGSRSLVVPEHPEYESNFSVFQKAFFSDEVMKNLDTAASVAEVIYEAATDGKDQLRYLAGSIAQAEFEKRNKLGAEGFHRDAMQLFFGK